MNPEGRDDTKIRYILCPYCGRTQPQTERCVECGGLFEPLSRKATQIAMGPWYVRNKQQPFRPGCSYEVLQKMAANGKLKATSVLRGPTTRQFWSVARYVPGVAHLVGYCHECGASASAEDTACAKCGETFVYETKRDKLGLHYPSTHAVEKAQRELDRELHGSPPPKVSKAQSKTQEKQDVVESAPRVLDFVPTDAHDSADVELETHALPAISPAVWVWLCLNFVAAAVAGVLLWLNLTID